MLTLQEAMDGLPNDQQKLHDLLVKNRCHGLQRDPFCCPVANYFIKKTGITTIVNHYIAMQADVCMMIIPDHIRIFIYDFDQGKYPDLIEK